MSERDVRFETLSGLPIKALYTPDDVPGTYAEKLGNPGEYPYTRGVYPTMYRGRLWTMRMFAGFGRPEDTNARFKYLLQEGQTGLSTAFDMPALMGYDADHPRARGEVGKEGVSISTLDDFERLFADIPLGDVTTSMTINCTASVALAMYLAVAEKQGVSWDRVGGTIQNDMLKEFIAQKEWICPPEPAVRIVTDMIEFTAKHVPRWNPVSISGYHIREAGSTAVQELAFTLADGLAYVEAALARGLDIDSFAPRLSFFFDVHNDFFEEIAKLRAARRLWARYMKERYGAKEPRSMRLRTHTQTAGVSATAQQPLNNIARVAIQALAAVLGGAQSLHTNSYDETWALPTEDAVTVALRTQQIIAEETGAALTIDPLGGSYYLESLTDQMEAEAAEYIATIDRMGGMIAAIDDGYPQKEIADAAYRYQLMEDRRREDHRRREQVRDDGREGHPLPQDRRGGGARADRAHRPLQGRARHGEGGEAPQAGRGGLPERPEPDAGARRRREGLREPRRDLGRVPPGLRPLPRAHHLLARTATMAHLLRWLAHPSLRRIGIRLSRASLAASHLDHSHHPRVAKNRACLHRRLLSDNASADRASPGEGEGAGVPHHARRSHDRDADSRAHARGGRGARGRRRRRRRGDGPRVGCTRGVDDRAGGGSHGAGHGAGCRRAALPDRGPAAARGAGLRRRGRPAPRIESPSRSCSHGMRAANAEVDALLGRAIEADATGRSHRADDPRVQPARTATPEFFDMELTWKGYAMTQRLHLLDHRSQIKKLRDAQGRPA